MASEQLSRRENTTTERDVQIEKNRVPKMATHFEHLAEQNKEGSDTPQGSIQELQGGESRKEHGGKAIGDMGGPGRARDSHELGTHFESLADKVKEEQEQKQDSHAAEAGSTVPPSNVGKSQVNAEENNGSSAEARGMDKSKHEIRTRELNTGRPKQSGVEEQTRESRGHVEAEKGRRESRGQAEAEKGQGVENRGEVRFKEEARKENNGSSVTARGMDKSKLEIRTRELNTGRPQQSGVEEQTRESRGHVEAEKGRRECRGQAEAEKGQGVENRGEARFREEAREEKLGRGTENRGEVEGRVGVETQGPATVITSTFEGGEKEERGRDARELEAAREIRSQEENGGRDGDREKESQSTLEDISKYRGQVQENAMEAIRAAQERYERAKNAAGETAQTAQEKAARSKDIAMEKAARAKDVTIEKAAQAKDVTLEKAAQARDVALEKDQQGYASTKDTISSTTQTASDYSSQAAEKAKSAGSNTAQYVGEKAVQAKDVTMETGKTVAEYAGKLAADLKDKATVAGWAAAHFSTEKTVEGTKAAVNLVQGTTGYAANKATKIASKSLGAVKGLAANAGETVKDYTARKKEEAEREYETKKASQQQETGGSPSSKSTGQEQGQESLEETGGRASAKSTGQEQGQEGGGMFRSITESLQGRGGQNQNRQEGGGIGETIGQYAQTTKKTVGDLAQTMKKPLGTVAQKGREALGAAEETGGNLAQTMKKPLDTAAQGGSEVIGAVRETVSEIGETMIKPAEIASTKVQEGEAGSGVIGAIEETIAEIAQITKAIVVGDDEIEAGSKRSIGSEFGSTTDRGYQGGLTYEERRKEETFEARKT